MQRKDHPNNISFIATEASLTERSIVGEPGRPDIEALLASERKYSPLALLLYRPPSLLFMALNGI